MLGGSVAGMLAARVLSDHADEVVVVEPDDVTASPRAGAPQGVQLHVLLEMGRLQLERWFPGLSQELLADGAVLCEGLGIHQYVDGRRKVAVPGNDMITSTRGFLEERVRRRVLARDNVTMLRGRADGLRFGADPRRGRVGGVYYVPAGGDRDGCGERDHLTADLVVDAMGRTSRLGVWLEQGGWRAPALERMRMDLGCTTAQFRRGGELPGLRAVISVASPVPTGAVQSDTAAMAEVEDDRWTVLLAGYGDRRPARDHDEFRARCDVLGAAPVREVVAAGEPIGPIAVHRMPDSRRLDFLGLPRFPGGLVVMGDAVASFNPLYGQGVTAAALHASCLSGHLRSGALPSEPARGYFERLRVVTDAAWNLSTLGDLARPSVGSQPRGYRTAHWYAALLTRASMTDAEVNRRFLDVVNMREHPRLLTRPGTAWRVAQALVAQGRRTGH